MMKAKRAGGQKLISDLCAVTSNRVKFNRNHHSTFTVLTIIALEDDLEKQAGSLYDWCCKFKNFLWTFCYRLKHLIYRKRAIDTVAAFHPPSICNSLSSCLGFLFLFSAILYKLIDRALINDKNVLINWYYILLINLANHGIY